MTDEEFGSYYVQRLQELPHFKRYTTAEFLNPHNPLWPQQSFDYPYGQAPEVDDLPPQELLDWGTYVESHYLDAATGAFGKNPSASVVALYGVKSLLASLHASLTDDLLLELLCEGLFSKFLSDLDDIDYARFGLTRSDPQTDPYLKIDLSCMQVIKPWKGESVAPTVVVVRRKRDGATSRWMHYFEDDGSCGYELVGIDIWHRNRAEDGKLLTPPPAGTSDETWRRSKFYALQGCLHRVNLIDHVVIHFPNDTINAITKSVLPTWHPLSQLLMPHFWLTLPVNNSVLEGYLSLINRDTWYPWTPFAAKGHQVRKLLPFSWKGWEYYFPRPSDPKPTDPPYSPNTSYPPYSFCLDPTSPPVEPKPAAVEPSAFRAMLNRLYGCTREFVRDVLSATNLAPPAEAGKPDLVWLEVERWAHEIARFLPGFPNEDRIGNPDVLASAVASVIWNGSIVHSYGHSALHTMMNTPQWPMPFVIRVPPDDSVGGVFKEFGGHTKVAKGLPPLDRLLGPPIEFLVKALQSGLQQKYPDLANLKADDLKALLEAAPLAGDILPLTSPADVLFGKMADLLFYQPHNSSLLYDCDYAFLPRAGSGSRADAFPNRFQLTQAQRDALRAACEKFRGQLDAFDADVDESKEQSQVRIKNCLPYARPPAQRPPSLPPPPGCPPTWTYADQEACRVQHCIAAGIQY